MKVSNLQLNDKFHCPSNFIPKGSEECKDEKPHDDLGVKNVGGVFLVLVGGCLLALVIAIFEFLWNIEKIAMKEKVRTFLTSIVCHSKAFNFSRSHHGTP